MVVSDTRPTMCETRGPEPELASYLRIEERELEAGGLNVSRVDIRSGASDRRALSDGGRVGR